MVAILFFICCNPINAKNSTVSNAFTIPFLKASTSGSIDQVVSNMLRFKNGTSRKMNLALDVSSAADRKALSARDKGYMFATGNSHFIPVRIIPCELLRLKTLSAKTKIELMFNVSLSYSTDLRLQSTIPGGFFSKAEITDLTQLLMQCSTVLDSQFYKGDYRVAPMLTAIYQASFYNLNTNSTLEECLKKLILTKT